MSIRRCKGVDVSIKGFLPTSTFNGLALGQFMYTNTGLPQAAPMLAGNPVSTIIASSQSGDGYRQSATHPNTRHLIQHAPVVRWALDVKLAPKRSIASSLHPDGAPPSLPRRTSHPATALARAPDGDATAPSHPGAALAEGHSIVDRLGRLNADDVADQEAAVDQMTQLASKLTPHECLELALAIEEECFGQDDVIVRRFAVRAIAPLALRLPPEDRPSRAISVLTQLAAYEDRNWDDVNALNDAVSDTVSATARDLMPDGRAALAEAVVPFLHSEDLYVRGYAVGLLEEIARPLDPAVRRKHLAEVLTLFRETSGDSAAARDLRECALPVLKGMLAALSPPDHDALLPAMWELAQDDGKRVRVFAIETLRDRALCASSEDALAIALKMLPCLDDWQSDPADAAEEGIAKIAQHLSPQDRRALIDGIKKFLEDETPSGGGTDRTVRLFEAVVALAPTTRAATGSEPARALSEEAAARELQATQLMRFAEGLRRKHPRTFDIVENNLAPLHIEEMIADLREGHDIPRGFLFNAGGGRFGFFQFIEGSQPLEDEFPFVYFFPGQDHLVENMLRTHGMRSGSEGLAIEIDISPLQLLEWVAASPRGLAERRSYVAIAGGQVKRFRDYLREQQISMRVLAPDDALPERDFLETFGKTFKEAAVAQGVQVVRDGEGRNRSAPYDPEAAARIAWRRARLLAVARHGHFSEHERLLSILPANPTDLGYQELGKLLRAHGFGTSFREYLTRRYGFWIR
jgi:hypothetical protein